MDKRRLKVGACAVVMGLLLAGESSAAPEMSEGAKKLYDKHCAHCHGVNGDAKTAAAPYYKPAPRVFTKGTKFKVRSTGTGELPTDEDLTRAIRDGLAFHLKHGAFTAMPPWPRFAEPELLLLVGHVKSFAPDFADPEVNKPKPMEIPSAPGSNEESIKRGREFFEKNECIKCHGVVGRGDGNSAPTLKDDYGAHIRPADLHKRFTFRGGGRKEDIFRTISTGFNGTPMPSYADSLNVPERWDLVNYIYSLSDRDHPNYNIADVPIRMVPVAQPLDLSSIEKVRELFKDAPPGIIPIVGQVIEPGRSFFPGINEVQVRAVYNQDEVALLLTWHDMQAETKGTNGPDVEAPKLGEEVTLPVEKAAKDENADPFADEEAASDPFAEEEAGGEAGGERGEAAVSKYSDAVAVQFPEKPQEGFVLPYFLFGDSKNPVDLWFFDLAKDTPSLYLGKGSTDVKPKEGAPVEGVHFYKEGEWTVVLKRKREAEQAMPFLEKTFVPVQFSIWDGFSEERGKKRGISAWYYLYIEPMEKQSPVGPMLSWGGGFLLLELLVIWWVRKNHGMH